MKQWMFTQPILQIILINECMQTLFAASASSLACIISIWISGTYCLTRVGTGLQQARMPGASLKTVTAQQ